MRKLLVFTIIFQCATSFAKVNFKMHFKDGDKLPYVYENYKMYLPLKEGGDTTYLTPKADTVYLYIGCDCPPDAVKERKENFWREFKIQLSYLRFLAKRKTLSTIAIHVVSGSFLLPNQGVDLSDSGKGTKDPKYWVPKGIKINQQAFIKNYGNYFEAAFQNHNLKIHVYNKGW